MNNKKVHVIDWEWMNAYDCKIFVLVAAGASLLVP
jgi:hypothetical protein